MRVLGVIILSVTGVVLLVFALVSFFAHNIVDSIWMHVTGTVGRIGGAGVQEAMEAGSNAPPWPAVVLALLAVVALVAAFLLAAAGTRRRVSLRMSSRAPYRDSGRSIFPRPPIRRRPGR